MAGKAAQISLGMQAITAIAAACHAANAAYCASLGDDSQPSWEDAPDWQVSSAINGVEFHLANPDAGDDASHSNWVKQKRADGWKFGKEKCEEKRTHPCLVAFDKLPPEQQFKDTLFRSIVHTLTPVLAPLDEELAVVKATLAVEQDKLVFASEAIEKADRAATEDAEKIALLEHELAAERSDFDEQPPLIFETVAASVKPMKLSAAGVSDCSLAEVIELLQDYGGGVLRLSDGSSEIAALVGFNVAADAFKVARGRLTIDIEQLLIVVPHSDEPLPDLAGVALVIDGEQVAWAPMVRPIPLEPGLNLNIAPNVVFEGFAPSEPAPAEAA